MPPKPVGDNSSRRYSIVSKGGGYTSWLWRYCRAAANCPARRRGRRRGSRDRQRRSLLIVVARDVLQRAVPRPIARLCPIRRPIVHPVNQASPCHQRTSRESPESGPSTCSRAAGESSTSSAVWAGQVSTGRSISWPPSRCRPSSSAFDVALLNRFARIGPHRFGRQLGFGKLDRCRWRLLGSDAIGVPFSPAGRRMIRRTMTAPAITVSNTAPNQSQRPRIFSFLPDRLSARTPVGRTLGAATGM